MIINYINLVLYLINKILFLISDRKIYKIKYEFFKNKYKLNKHINEGTIYVIGDSHTGLFANNNFQQNCYIASTEKNWFLAANYSKAPELIIFHLDAAIAKNAFKRDTTIRAREKIEYLIEHSFIRARHKIVLSFGEIDCRVHVKRQSEIQELPVDVILKDIIQDYCKLIDYFINLGMNVVIYGPPGQQPDTITIDPQYPRYGTEIERNKIVEKFNKQLKKIADEKGINFFSLYYETTDKYRTNISLYRDGVHLSNTMHNILLDKLHEIIGNPNDK